VCARMTIMAIFDKNRGSGNRWEGMDAEFEPSARISQSERRKCIKRAKRDMKR